VSTLTTATGRTARLGHSPVAALIGKACRDRVQVVAAASFYMLLIGTVLGLLWPPLRDLFRSLPVGMNDLVVAISGGTDLSTPVGWADAELLSLLAPAAAIVVAVLSASGAAVEEEDKTLGVALGLPVDRGVYLGSKMVAMVILDAVVALCVGIGLALGDLVGQLGFTAAGITGAASHVLLLGLVYGAFAFLVGGLTGSPRLAVVLSALAAVLSFAAAVFLPLSASVRGGRLVNPWFYYERSTPLAHGADAGDLLVLAGVALLLMVGAVVAFRRRDLRG
jgi:ABC-2 type transport system permease protein